MTEEVWRNCVSCGKAKDDAPIPELCSHKKRTGLAQCRPWIPKSLNSKETSDQK